MMNPETEVRRLTATLAVWQQYSSEVKAELFSTALSTDSGAYLVDPIYLDPDLLINLLGSSTVAGVIVTNGNHEREASRYARQFDVPLYARAETGILGAFPFPENEPLKGDLRTIALEGAATGECAIYDGREGGTLVVGDALINMGAAGFTFLPGKYCSNQKQMKKSLRNLLTLPFERLLFAHGSPLMGDARARLRALLDGAP